MRTVHVGRRTRPLLASLAVVALLVTAVTPVVADPLQRDQWGLERIRAPEAWATARGEGIVIAVLDTGVDLQHPDLEPQLLRDGDGAVVGRDFVDGDATMQDPDGHGTMVAGIAAAADNDEGIVGVAPAARIMPVRVLGNDGAGTSAVVEQGIRWAVRQGADVINLSLAPSPDVRAAQLGSAAADAVREAWRRGVIVVAAAGNTGDATRFPQDLPLLLVGATDRADRRAPFSDVSRESAVMAPGVEIVTSWCLEDDAGCEGATHTYGEAEGTSFAAAFVSGAAAVLRSSGLDHRDTVSALQLGARDLADPGPDDATGHGLIDLVGSLELGAGGRPSDGATPPPSSTPSDPDAATGAPDAATGAPDAGDGGVLDSGTALLGLGAVAAALLIVVWVGVARLRKGD